MKYDIYESGKRIQELRRARNMTQTELADGLNISLDHVKKIERGQRGCSVDLLISVSVILQTTLDYLVLGKCPERTVNPDAIQSVIDQLMILKNAL